MTLISHFPPGEHEKVIKVEIDKKELGATKFFEEEFLEATTWWDYNLYQPICNESTNGQRKWEGKWEKKLCLYTEKEMITRTINNSGSGTNFVIHSCMRKLSKGWVS